MNERSVPVSKTNFAAMARAQNDVYMVCADSANNDDNTLSALEDGTLKRGELQRNAANICRFLMDTQAMKRLCGEADTIKIINRPDDGGEDLADVTFYNLDEELTLIPENICTDRGSNFTFAVDVSHLGKYKIVITASSEQSELAQLPLTFFSMGSPVASFTWNGTGGKPVSKEFSIFLFSRFTSMRIYFAQSGLKIHDIKFTFVDEV